MHSYGFVEPFNVGGAYVRGTELVWNGALFGRLSLSGSWTFQRSEVTNSSKSYHIDKELPNRPDQYGTATLEAPVGRLSFFWTVNRKDSYYLDRANQDHMKYPGRTLHDAGCSIGMMKNRITRPQDMIRSIPDM